MLWRCVNAGIYIGADKRPEDWRYVIPSDAAATEPEIASNRETFNQDMTRCQRGKRFASALMRLFPARE